jgi:hypothetical protein
MCVILFGPYHLWIKWTQIGYMHYTLTYKIRKNISQRERSEEGGVSKFQNRTLFGSIVLEPPQKKNEFLISLSCRHKRQNFLISLSLIYCHIIPLLCLTTWTHVLSSDQIIWFLFEELYNATNLDNNV